MNYQRKTKPALWLSVAGAQMVRSRKKETPDQKRRRELDAMARGLRRVRPSTVAKRKATREQNDRYRNRVREWIKGKQCVGCLISAVHGETDEFPVRRATQCHHKHGRGNRGELLMVERLWTPVCGACHVWIHANVEAARQLGLYAPRGEWNRLPKVFENKALLSGQNTPK